MAMGSDLGLCALNTHSIVQVLVFEGWEHKHEEVELDDRFLLYQLDVICVCMMYEYSRKWVA